VSVKAKIVTLSPFGAHLLPKPVSAAPVETLTIERLQAVRVSQQPHAGIHDLKVQRSTKVSQRHCHHFWTQLLSNQYACLTLRPGKLLIARDLTQTVADSFLYLALSL
jgi:hypothetical protein